MAINIHNLIAAISPDVFCDPSVRDSVKAQVESALQEGNKNAYSDAAKTAKPVTYDFIDLIDIQYTNASSKPGFKAPIEKHVLSYDSFSESLEPLYFWILDQMSQEFKVLDKITDNFVASPGSAHFSEMGMKATKMQEEGMKMLGAANQVIKSILNIIYDLKEFKIRLKVYDKLKSEDIGERRDALLSLKQVWLDTVDIKRGTSSIKGMLQQFDYVTLIDAFMSINSAEEVAKVDLNERVKRILHQRIPEFELWVKESEHELRKRFEIEKTYLESQVNTVKLYSRWAKPYLKAAQALEQRASPTASLVNAFNTVLFELTLLGQADYKPDDDIKSGNLPGLFATITKKKFSEVLVAEFNFRSIPERAGQQGYGFRGKADVTLTSYALTDSELKVLKRELERDDLKDAVGLVEGATDRSLGQLSTDIEEILGTKEKKEDKKSKKESDNPFSALFSGLTELFEPSKKEEKTEDPYKITPDNEYEQIIRSQAIIGARKRCYRVYDLYKKNHKMPSLPGYA